ncbi:MAG: glycoside hydrolase family 2 TIM barrel-domain containing protein [Brevefilum sp.]|nr:glycoside hydrolase family 2 TIM barrel-domain containing protein [Brevefilum sp.]
MKAKFLFLIVIGLGLILSGCQSPNQVTQTESVSAAALGVDSDTLLPSLSFQETETLDGETVPIAWQAGNPLASFDPQERQRIDLAGTWLKERFEADSSLSLSGRGSDGLTALEAEAMGRFQADYDDSDWDEIQLPKPENVMTAYGPEDYQGGVWYRRSVFVPVEWKGQRVTFNALAINYVADIWVNDQWVGYHEGGYTPFALDISPSLIYGEENTIAIRVDNPPWGSRNDIVPGLTPDWWNYTGIIQDFYLEAAPPLWIVRTDVRIPDTSGDILVDVVLHNSGDRSQKGSLTLQVHSTDPNAPGWLTNPQPSAIKASAAGKPISMEVKLEPGQALVIPDVQLTIPKPELWSPGSPVLYLLETSLKTNHSSDSFMTQFGIRTVQSNGHQWLLNGDPYFMAGIARHEEWPDSGRTATWDKILVDLEMIKAHNANFVRTAHYPNHPYTYLLTDRLGLLAAVEIPVWQYGPAEFAAQEQRQIADQMWREMVLMGSNRPSIILWSMHNESQAVPERQAYIQRLTKDYEQYLQDGRLLMQSAAADRGGSSDPTQTALDIAGWTLYFGVFYGEDYADDSMTFLQEAHAAFPEKPILVTEYGIWSKGGNSSKQRQMELFDALFPVFLESAAWGADQQINPNGYIGGITWWAMFDWYTAHTREQTMGLYDMDRVQGKPIAENLAGAYAIWVRDQP